MKFMIFKTAIVLLLISTNISPARSISATQVKIPIVTYETRPTTIQVARTVYDTQNYDCSFYSTVPASNFCNNGSEDRFADFTTSCTYKASYQKLNKQTCQRQVPRTVYDTVNSTEQVEVTTYKYEWRCPAGYKLHSESERGKKTYWCNNDTGGHSGGPGGGR